MRGIRIEPSSVTIHDYADELLDLCSMARESMEKSCYWCEQRYRNGKSIAEMLRQRKACGVESISIDEAIEQVRNAAS